MNTATARYTWLRENAPLLGVGALLSLAFLLLGISRQAPPDAFVPPSSAEIANPTNREPVPNLDALPATAEDTVVVSQLAPDDAQSRNAATAFAAVGPGKAKPFAFHGSSTDRTRARDCLALAGLAEAGAGDGDQRAVMQVILNRVRHPAFAKTVCGVVFEGSQRAIGCQFSFTCDGSLARTYSDALWREARARAEDMLGGATYAPVGNATHFHTDYVYPWWSDKLDKVARVGPHLFFRWRGYWGARQALSARYAGGEPDPLALRQTAQAVAAANPLPTLLQSGEAVRSITAPPSPAATPVPGRGGPLAPSDTSAPASPGPGVHFVLVARGDSPEALVARARALCPGDRYCQVYGWDDGAVIPERLPLPPAARHALRFSFVPARSGNAETVYFDCDLFPSSPLGVCLPRARP